MILAEIIKICIWKAWIRVFEISRDKAWIWTYVILNTYTQAHPCIFQFSMSGCKDIAKILLKCHSGFVASQRLMTTDLRGAWKTVQKINKNHFSKYEFSLGYLILLQIISLYAPNQIFSSSHIYLLNWTSLWLDCLLSPRPIQYLSHPKTGFSQYTLKLCAQPWQCSCTWIYHTSVN